jgi:hypothetical protein
MQKQARKYYTPEEYLALEETAEERSEYYLNGILNLPEIGFQISIKEIYDKVEFEKE